MDENMGSEKPVLKTKRPPRKKPMWQQVKEHWLPTLAGLLATVLVILANAPEAVENIRVGLKSFIQWALGA